MGKKIEFIRQKAESYILDPRKNFEKTGCPIEIRIDPLTGRTGRLCHFGGITPQKLNFDLYINPETRGFCPFCPETRDKFTPKFPPEILPEGRMTKGEAYLFSNLYPYDLFSAVVVMTDAHLVKVNEFTEKQILDTLSLGIEFLKIIQKKHPEIPYYLMGWNYMPPSGSSIVHPHQQFLASKTPGNQYMDELRASEVYYKENNSNFWIDLIEEEKKLGERYIAELGSGFWLSSFVSSGTLGEIIAIFPEVYTLEDLTEKHLEDLTKGIMKVLVFYGDHQMYSFNGSLFLGPKGQNYFSAHFRMVARTYLNSLNYPADFFFVQVLFKDPVCAIYPEELAQKLKPYF